MLLYFKIFLNGVEYSFLPNPCLLEEGGAAPAGAREWYLFNEPLVQEAGNSVNTIA